MRRPNEPGRSNTVCLFGGKHAARSTACGTGVARRFSWRIGQRTQRTRRGPDLPLKCVRSDRPCGESISGRIPAGVMSDVKTSVGLLVGEGDARPT